MKSCYVIRLSLSALAIADIVQYHPDAVRPDGWMITRINVPNEFRGRGHGSSLLKKIIADADKENEKLWLEVFSYGVLTFDDLSAWYRRYGFRGPDTGVLCRMPSVPPAA